MAKVECKVCGKVCVSELGLLKHINVKTDHPSVEEYKRIYNGKTNFNMDLIIPVCNMGDDSYKYRLRNLESIVRVMPQNIHLIIVEQMLDPTLPLYSNNIRIPTNKSITKILVRYFIFNKGWLFNIGVRNAKTPHILLGEGDTGVDLNYFTELYKFAKKRPKNKIRRWFFAWDEIIYWDETFSKKIRVAKPTRGMSEGGILYYNKTAYWEMGGASEWFLELGGIDNEMALRASHMFKSYDMFPWTINHLYHPVSHVKKDKWINGQYRLENRRIYYATKKDPDKMIRFLRKHKDKAGSKDAPLCATVELEI